MGRPKKEQPNHGSLYEVKITVGKKLNGSLVRKSFYSEISKADAKNKAEEWKANKLVAERAGEIFVEKEISFADWAKRWLETYKKGKVKQHTYDYTYRINVENYMVPFFGTAKLNNITQADIQDYFNKHNYLAENNLKRHRTILNSIFEKAIYNDLCRKNPVKSIDYASIKENRPRQAYNQAQVDKLTEYSTGKKHGELIIILLNTGMRRGELLGLKWLDIDYDNLTVSVKRAIAPDTKEPKDGDLKSKSSRRVIPISQDFADYLKSLPHKTDFVIPGKTKYGHMSLATFEFYYKEYMKEACEKLELPYLVPHELRHTFGTVLREKGVDIYTISKVLGHGDISITEKIYVHNDLDVLRKNMNLDDKSGTGVVQVSYGRKFRLKKAKRKPAQSPE